MNRVQEHLLKHTSDDLFFFQGKPFTGVAVRASRDGGLLAENEYRDGLRWGLRRAWYAPGQLASEAEFAWNLLSGLSREWHGNGQLALEGVYELGICLKRKRWDEQGKVIEDYVLKPTDRNYHILQLQREEFARMSSLSNSRVAPPGGNDSL